MKKILIVAVILLVSLNNFMLISKNKKPELESVKVDTEQSYVVGEDIQLGNYLIDTDGKEVTLTLTYLSGDTKEVMKNDNEVFIIDPNVKEIKTDKSVSLNKRY